MKLILTFTFIALSTTGLLAQDKKAGDKPVVKTSQQKAATTNDKPDSVYVPEVKSYLKLNQSPEDQNFEMLRNQKMMKPNTDLINVPEKK